MKFIIDFFPLLAFFIAYKQGGIYTATWVVMIAIAIQIAYLKITRKPVEAMHWFGLVMVVVFGGLTLYLKDESFIKLRPTVVNWVFAALLVIGPLFFKKNFLKSLLGTVLQVPDKQWAIANHISIVYFIAVGFLNYAATKVLTTDQWVNFKVFGLYGINIFFIFGLIIYLARYAQDPTKPEGAAGAHAAGDESSNQSKPGA